MALMSPQSGGDGEHYSVGGTVRVSETWEEREGEGEGEGERGSLERESAGSMGGSLTETSLPSQTSSFVPGCEPFPKEGPSVRA